MEMDSTETTENSVSTEVSGKSGIYGEPKMLPRVGDRYQVEIPSLVRVSDHLRLLKNVDQIEISDIESSNRFIAMSIPLMWISEEAENKDDSMPKLDPKSGESETSVSRHSYGGKGCRLVPGSLNNSWSEVEESGFVLGLYVFGKKFVMVKKLTVSKQMGDILSHYYGNSFRSGEYRRWSGCRKMKNREIFGQRIFTGWRHREFLSRLLRKASEEHRNAVLELSEAFGEGKLALEEYFFALEAKLGVRAVFEAVGIGEGKRDLTGNLAETPKSHQPVRARREIPAGKPLNSLTPKEIIGILTGELRLSKALTSDLFWASVWPRLLARGWHSEQPNGSSKGLVYLAPGIKKFSRSDLVKGDDYYDSVSDILNLVVSKQDLLEIDDFEDEEENGSSVQTESDRQEGFVDERARKAREVRTLPSKLLGAYASLCPSEEGDDGDSSKVSNTITNGLKPAHAFPANRLALLALPAFNVLQAKKGAKSKPSQKEGPENNSHLSPRVAKHRKKLHLPSLTNSILQQESSSDLSANALFRSEPSQEKQPLSTSSTRTIDPNVPVSQTVKIDKAFVTGSTESHDQKTNEAPENPRAPKFPEPSQEKQPLSTISTRAIDKPENPRAQNFPERPCRQSKRNRPLTAKALEAFAFGFMETKQKRKAKEACPGEDPGLRTSTRRVRRKVSGPPASFEPIPTVDFPMEERESSIQNANYCNVFNKLGISSQTG